MKPTINLSTLSTDSRVIAFREYYLNEVQDNPTLYTSYLCPDQIDVYLPANLSEFANSAAGHSGIAGGCKAKGIRKYSTNPLADVAHIFSSDTNLAAFLLSSECDFAEYRREIMKKQYANIAERPINNTMVTDCYKHANKKYKFNKLMAKYGRRIVLDAIYNLTMSEFELRFGI